MKKKRGPRLVGKHHTTYYEVKSVKRFTIQPLLHINWHLGVWFHPSFVEIEFS